MKLNLNPFKKNPFGKVVTKLKENYLAAGALQALGVVLYLAIFLALSANGPMIFFNVVPNPVLMTAIVFLMVIITVIVLLTLVFAYPLYLAIQKKFCEAFMVIVWTVLGIIIATTLVVGIAIKTGTSYEDYYGNMYNGTTEIPSTY